jgi:Protein of unknown function (DUF3108).
MRLPVFCLLIFLLGWGNSTGRAYAVEMQPSQIDQAVLAAIFSGTEVMHYAVSWSGGVKIGDIHLSIQREQGREDAYVILAKVKDYGPLTVLYPIDDRFACFVHGPMKFPDRYEVLQKEGFGRKTSRFTRYDQANRIVWYRKNKEEEQRFEVDGPVYNEFASFIITRALAFHEGESVVVPTFAERKRHEVEVSLVKRENRKTIFSRRQPVVVVQPRMQFKGVYEKSGTTTLWITDDLCRVPVEIHTKIAIGSLVAELVGYANSACPELTKAAATRRRP